MTWRKRLLPGSFRDAAFETEAHDVALGRRVAVHEYPLRDTPYAEDLGRKAEEFTLECYVIGPDYLAARDRLLEAIRRPGPGQLVHPYVGTLQVVVTGARLSESTREGGMARFSLTCIEAGSNTYPQAAPDTQAAVATQAGLADTAIAADFAAGFSVAGHPQFVFDAAVKQLNDVGTSLTTLADSLSALPAPAAALRRSLTVFSQGLTSLIGAPADLAAAVIGLVAELGALAAQPASAYGLYARLGDFGEGAPVVPATTPSRARQADNQQAVTALVQRAALTGQARASRLRTYDNFTEAEGARTELVTRFDSLMDVATNDAVYYALATLRATVTRDIGARGANLARIVAYTPRATLPALAIAHTLYRDATRAEELTRRNRIPHPGFVAGGLPLEVLTDA